MSIAMISPPAAKFLAIYHIVSTKLLPGNGNMAL